MLWTTLYPFGHAVDHFCQYNTHVLRDCAHVLRDFLTRPRHFAADKNKRTREFGHGTKRKSPALGPHYQPLKVKLPIASINTFVFVVAIDMFALEVYSGVLELGSVVWVFFVLFWGVVSCGQK
jgi:hypothetical protein